MHDNNKQKRGNSLSTILLRFEFWSKFLNL
jgi:hypothetical protein